MPRKQHGLDGQDMCPVCYGRTSLGRAGEFHGERVLICHQCRRLFHPNGTELSEQEKEEYKVEVAKSWKAYEERHGKL